ncbi:response regulator transcription factor [Mucilaginibacter pedocola]|uniref:DNA-binding response regulator n=1 Tax=Mucilaginibacter pedocola TaxID=1792845 RepID=A0A1S9P6W1_9SPHI|nr:response regulator transcription factor [Mucilaginibacter pedocola]OOQ56691.1 DNA-binding response regulator [Mucilaginibacter pedocola]
MKILIVEDEQALRQNMLSYLSEDNNVCEACTDLAGAVYKLSCYNYDFVLLDIGLPDGEGFEVLNYLRKEMRSEAVIIISARNSLDDRLKGLNIGADDYLVKPFHLAELKARIFAVFRRRAGNNNNLLVFNEITIDLNGRNVLINGNEIILTRKEYDMLLYFIANKGKVVSKTAIAEHLWGDEMDMHDNFDFLYSHVKNLRKKLLDAQATEYLKSIYGIGYKFTDK